MASDGHTYEKDATVEWLAASVLRRVDHMKTAGKPLLVHLIPLHMQGWPDMLSCAAACQEYVASDAVHHHMKERARNYSCLQIFSLCRHCSPNADVSLMCPCLHTAATVILQILHPCAKDCQSAVIPRPTMTHPGPYNKWLQMC